MLTCEFSWTRTAPRNPVHLQHGRDPVCDHGRFSLLAGIHSSLSVPGERIEESKVPLPATAPTVGPTTKRYVGTKRYSNSRAFRRSECIRSYSPRGPQASILFGGRSRRICMIGVAHPSADHTLICVGGQQTGERRVRGGILGARRQDRLAGRRFIHRPCG